MTRRFLYIIMTLCVLAMSACHTSRNTAKENAGTTPGARADEGWTNVYMPVTVRMEAPMAISLSGRATMVRDSVINISMRVLGMEVAVANITADTVQLVDKFHKYYFAESTSALLGRHNMTLERMQNLILGHDRKDGGTLSFDNPRGGQPFTITFGDITATPAGNLAGSVNIDGSLSNKNVDATLLWQFDRAVWNDPSRTVSFTPPTRGYTRIKAADVMSMFRL